MVKRPEEHVKETKSFKIFLNSVPNEWIARKIEQDYALDMEIEIVAAGRLSGKTLLAQLKSSQSLSSENGFIKFSFETSKLRYYLEKDVPVILVLIDLTNQECYWLFTQEYVYEILDKTDSSWTQKKTITLKLPIGNVWSRSLDILKDIAFEGPFYLLMKRISSIQTRTMLKWKRDTGTGSTLEDFKREMTTTAQKIGLELSYRYGKEGKPSESLRVLLEVYEKSGINSLNRMKAIAGLLWQFTPTNFDENKRLFNLASEGLALARKLENEFYFLYFKGIGIQTVFFKLVLELGNELVLKKVSEQAKGSFLVPMLAIYASETMQKLLEVKSDFMSTLTEAESKKQYYVFEDLMRRFALMQIFLHQNMVIWIDSEKMMDLLVSARTALEFSLKIAEVSNQKEMECIILEDFALFHHITKNVEMRRKALNKCIRTAEEIGHVGFAGSAKRKYEYFQKAPSVITGPKDVPKSTEKDFENLTDDEVDKMHRYLLQIAGIDVDGNDELAELARVGLKDRNPERVLKHCEHLYVEIVTYGPIWDMVGLPSTGKKLLFCKKKGFLMGWRLDDIFEEFKKANCSDCRFHSPRSNDWKWTHRWQREKGVPEKMREILKNIRRL